MVHLFRPATDPSVQRTLLLLHGTGGNEMSLIPLGETLLPGAALLSCRGAVREGSANRFFRRLAEGVFDLADVEIRAAEMAAFLDEAIGEYGLVPEQVTAVGFSNGANMAAITMLLHPGRFTSAILIRAQTVLVPEALPSLTGNNVLLLSGSEDPLVPVEDAKKLAFSLRDAGAHVDHQVLNAGHQLTRTDLDLGREFLTSLDS